MDVDKTKEGLLQVGTAILKISSEFYLTFHALEDRSTLIFPDFICVVF